MADTYLETISQFYDEKMKFLTKKDKFVYCRDCSNPKVFKETETELQFTCGSNTGDCGVQIKIQLPIYIHYETQVNELKEKIKKNLNWNVLKEYIDADKKANEQNVENKMIEEALIHISDIFKEQNIKSKEQSLQKFYNNRIQKTKRCKVLKKQLLNKDITPEQKKLIHTEYVTHVIEMKKEYEITKRLVDEINPYHQQEPPKITIQNTHFHQENKKAKTKKEIKKEDPDELKLIGRILEHFKNNNGIMTKSDYNRKVKKPNKTTWGARLFKSLQKGDHSWLREDQEKIGSIINSPSIKNPNQIKLTKKWISHLYIFDGASDDDLSDDDLSDDDLSDDDLSDGSEPEPEPMEEQTEEKTEELTEEQTNKEITLEDVHTAKQNAKIIWKPKGSDETEKGYLDKVDKRLKTKVKIINKYDGSMKIDISDLVEIINS
jgi:hypothetical protein